jgi:hypothetical protein
MTAAVGRVTLDFLQSRTLDALAGPAGLVVSLLLALLLLEYEIARVLGGERAMRLQRALAVAIAPLLLAFVLLVTIRLAVIARVGPLP